MLKTAFENLRSRSPLIHNITNYVTVNDCANMVLACGASPIMADDAAEVEDITTICGGLNINIGTLNSRTITSMLLAGKKANQLGHPVVLDPVGAGASRLRTDTAFRLLRDVKFTVIRGNISEIKTLASGAGTTKGVDADVADKVTEENLDSAVAFAKKFAAQTGAVIAITGAIDIVADAEIKGIKDEFFVIVPDDEHEGCFLPYLYVQLKDGYTLDDVRDKINACLPERYMRPVEIFTVPERPFFHFKTNRIGLSKEIIAKRNQQKEKAKRNSFADGCIA